MPREEGPFRARAAESSPAPASRAGGGLPAALLLVFCSWSLLLVAGPLAQLGLARDAALFATFLLATLLAVLVRPRRPPRRRSVSALLLGMGLLAGFATFPAWLGLIAGTGLALGLTPALPVPPGAGAPLLWLSSVGLAPVFEELVYRERLLPALARRFGARSALVLSSAAFALPHLEPWTVLATFLVGLALGAVMQATGAVALCIGLHMGLNLAAAVLGVSAAGSLLELGVSAVAGGLVLLAALGLTGGRPDLSGGC